MEVYMLGRGWIKVIRLYRLLRGGPELPWMVPIGWRNLSGVVWYVDTRKSK